MKLVYVTTNLNIGGAERQLCYLIRDLDKSKYTPYVIPLWPGDMMRTAFEAAGATIIPVYKSWKFDITVLLRLRRLLREISPDIVHCQLYTANVWGRIAAALAGCRHIVVAERNSDYLWKTSLHFSVERLLKPFTQAYTGNSRRVCAYGEANLHLPCGTFRLMYNGVDLSEFTPRDESELQPGPRVIGTVANLQPKKDLQTFLRMAARVHAAYPGTRFVIVGYGPEKDALQRLARQLNIDSQVTFAGKCDNVHELYRSFDVFVLSSVHEGFANVIVEAMASGVPVVATDVGGAPDAIEHGNSGFVVPPREPVAMADQVCELLASDHIRVAMGRAARARAVNQFSLSAMVRRYCDLYDELLGYKPPEADAVRHNVSEHSQTALASTR